MRRFRRRRTRSAGRLCRYRLLVEPDVLHAPAVGDAVDHDRQSFHIGLPAAGTSIVKDDRASIVLGQLSFDFPIRVSGYFNVFVGLECAEFEWASADRVLPHVTRWNMAGIDRRIPGSKSRDKSWLRPPQMKSDFVVAIRG